MKRIPLTQDKFTLVDDEDYDVLSQHKWYANKKGNTFYAKRTPDRRAIYMHREVMGLQVGDGQMVDHIDHNGLNNQKSNLRICTQQQNLMNQKKAKNKSSKYKGVSFHKPLNKWRAEIQFDKKSIHLGYFDSELEAARAYDVAAIKYFGEFALINKEEECSFPQAK